MTDKPPSIFPVLMVETKMSSAAPSISLAALRASGVSRSSSFSISFNAVFLRPSSASMPDQTVSKSNGQPHEQPSGAEQPKRRWLRTWMLTNLWTTLAGLLGTGWLLVGLAVGRGGGLISDRNARRTARARRAAGDRRFRHRLFQPELPEALLRSTSSRWTSHSFAIWCRTAATR